MILNSPYISGSLTVTGNTTIQGQLTVTGSLSGTASLASNALLLQGTGSTGFATTASVLQVSSSQQEISSSLLQVSASYISLSGSYNTFSGSASTRITENSSSIQQVSSSQQQISSSYIALSGSYNTFSGSASTRVTQIENVYATTGSNSFRSDQSITGSLVVSSTITAQTLVVQTVTSSIVYSSGSNLFGNQLSNTQTFTGSVNITGSLAIAGNINGNAITATGLLYANGGESNTLYTGAFLWTPGSYNFFNQKTDHSLVIGTYNANSPVAALTITQAGTSIFSNTVCASILTAATVSAGSPTNSRIVANANQMYGYYDVEANPRWTLGRDVWAGGSGGLAFGVGGTTTCYSMIGDPSGYGCTIAFATLVPSGCSGTTYERMRITSGGEVGIGVTPTSGNRFWVKGSSTSGGDTTILAQNSAGTNLFYVLNNGNVIMPSGNVGIATDAPSTKLEVCSGYIKNTGATNASGYLYYNTSANYTLSLSGNASYAQLYSTDNIALMFGNNNLSRMFIQTNGFIGIATTSPKAVFDVACGNAHSIISTWCKAANNGTMYNGFDIIMDESSFSGQLYVQANGGGIGIQATYDVLASYDRLCVILRNCMNRGNSECLTIPSYFSQSGGKRICIQQNNGSAAAMNISAMLVGTAYGGSYICAQG